MPLKLSRKWIKSGSVGFSGRIHSNLRFQSVGKVRRYIYTEINAVNMIDWIFKKSNKNPVIFHFVYLCCHTLIHKAQPVLNNKNVHSSFWWREKGSLIFNGNKEYFTVFSKCLTWATWATQNEHLLAFSSQQLCIQQKHWVG